MEENSATKAIKTVIKLHGPKYVKQEPYVDDKGIWIPFHEYVEEGTASTYQCIMTKELFIEAYNKFIKEN